MMSGDRELATKQVKEVCPKMVRDAAEILAEAKVDPIHE
jgi:hypothetical protein